MSTGSTNGTAVFARRVAGTFGVRVLIAGGSLLAGIIIARWLGSAGLGIWATLNVITLLAITLGGFGLPSAITYLVARDTSRTRKILEAAVGFAVIVGGVGAVAIAGGAILLPKVFGSVPPDLVMLVALALPFQMASYFCLGALLGLERIRTYNLADMSMQSLVLANASMTLVLLGFDIRALVVFNTAAAIIFAMVIIVVTFASADRPEETATRTELMREMLDHGSRFFISLAAGIVILRGDLLIVNYFRGPEEAGIYAVATQASIFLHMIPNVISTILFPKTSGAGDETGELTSRVTRPATLLIFLLCLAAVPACFLLPLLYGSAFADLPKLFLILLPGVFLLGIETIQVQHFTGLGLPRRIPIYWLATMAVNIGLNLLLVPRYGIFAAAIVSTFSYALIFVLVAQFFSSRTGRTLSEMFVVRRSEMGQLVPRG